MPKRPRRKMNKRRRNSPKTVIHIGGPRRRRGYGYRRYNSTRNGPLGFLFFIIITMMMLMIAMTSTLKQTEGFTLPEMPEISNVKALLGFGKDEEKK